ncbi:hypothetical protein [Nocardia sp. NPDC052566]|uniref:hypothetical protein n=1 Tax=Nocardia sp. NPDC052566 TaxID=3364330 RepID=UPI0037C7C1F4
MAIRGNPANHYVLSGGVDGIVDTSSLHGKPNITLRVGGNEVAEVELLDTEIGLEITGIIDAKPDLFVEYLRLLLPRVNVHDGAVEFAGLAVRIRSATTIGGPDLVQGAVESYQAVPVAGQADAVEF